MNWHGKTIFLTGASSGIGEGLALAFAMKGAVLGLVARREELLRELAERCEKAGGVARAYPADVTDPSAMRIPSSSLPLPPVIVVSPRT